MAMNWKAAHRLVQALTNGGLEVQDRGGQPWLADYNDAPGPPLTPGEMTIETLTEIAKAWLETAQN